MLPSFRTLIIYCITRFCRISNSPGITSYFVAQIKHMLQPDMRMNKYIVDQVQQHTLDYSATQSNGQENWNIHNNSNDSNNEHIINNESYIDLTMMSMTHIYVA